MRMQNAKMEFVTFDAQDVIATSGSTTMAARINLIRDYNIQATDNDYLYNKTGGLTGGLDPNDVQHPTKGNWWLWYDGSQVDILPRWDGKNQNILLRAAEESASENQPAADVIAWEVADIVNWLTANGHLFQ